MQPLKCELLTQMSCSVESSGPWVQATRNVKTVMQFVINETDIFPLVCSISLVVGNLSGLLEVKRNYE